MSTWTNTDLLAHQQRLQDLQRAAQRQQLAHEALKERRSWTTRALTTLRHRLDQWNTRLQNRTQARERAHMRDTTMQGI